MELPVGMPRAPHPRDSAVAGRDRTSVRRCNWFLLILSEEALNSKWVKRELAYALEDDRYNDHILPIVKTSGRLLRAILDTVLDPARSLSPSISTRGVPTCGRSGGSSIGPIEPFQAFAHQRIARIPRSGGRILGKVISGRPADDADDVDLRQSPQQFLSRGVADSGPPEVQALEAGESPEMD